MSYVLVSDECDTIEVIGDDRHGDIFDTHEEAVEAKVEAMKEIKEVFDEVFELEEVWDI